VVSKGIDDLPVGVYYFDPISAQVVSVPDHGDAEQIDTACFGKGGILTAGAVIVVTCRWLRHSWKYRYDRSYRMLMLEVGHIVQAINLAMIGHGLNVYHCPSINDRSLRQILAIDDDCAEGPVYALGLGHGGIR
jgi:SagB-type dehydrogenase family enzyme